jgi:phage I-like protein
MGSISAHAKGKKEALAPRLVEGARGAYGAVDGEIVTLDARAFATEGSSTDTPARQSIRLFQWGDNPTDKGTLILDRAGADEVLRRFAQRGNALPFDFEHQMFSDGIAGPVPAAGWIEQGGIQARDDGLYVTVAWTERARTALNAREYRYFSPTVLTDKSKRVVELLPPALVNYPAMYGLQPLAAKGGRTATEETTAGHEAGKGTHMKVLLKALRLGDDATEVEAVEAVNIRNNVVDDVVRLTGKADLTEARGTLAAIVADAKRGAEAIVELGALKAQMLGDEEKALLDEAVTSLKVSPADAKELAARPDAGSPAGVKWLRSYLEKKTPVQSKTASTTGEEQNGETTVKLSSSDKAWCRTQGIDEKSFAAHKAKRASERRTTRGDDA